MMCFVRGWFGERGNLAGDWKAASFVVFTAAAVLSMSEPSKGRFFLPFEELSLALRSTKSAPLSLQQKIHPGDARQTYSWASEHIPSCLSHFRGGYRGNLPSPPPPLPGCILAPHRAALSKTQQPTSNIFTLHFSFLKHCFSAGKLVTRLCIFICKTQFREQYVNTDKKKSPSSPCRRIRKTFAGRCERCQVLGLVHILHFIKTLLFRSPLQCCVIKSACWVGLTGTTMVILVSPWLEVI